TPSPQPSPQGERELTAALSARGRELAATLSSRGGELAAALSARERILQAFSLSLRSETE
ncbi:MAG: hypothetical protein WCD20_19190, partial [Rhodomicrobium sp.]